MGLFNVSRETLSRELRKRIMFHVKHMWIIIKKGGIMFEKGRDRWTKMQMPCLHEQMRFWTYDERSDRESAAFEALPDKKKGQRQRPKRSFRGSA